MSCPNTPQKPIVKRERPFESPSIDRSIAAFNPPKLKPEIKRECPFYDEDDDDDKEVPPQTPTKASCPCCKLCQTLLILKYVNADNPNGNAGRPYYICPSCTWDCRWHGWADSHGLNASNPCCDCDQPSRQDRIGQDNKRAPGMGFWTCAIGVCDYYSEHEDGTRGAVFDDLRGSFEPWLLPKPWWLRVKRKVV